MDTYNDIFGAEIEPPFPVVPREPYAPLAVNTDVVGFPHTLPIELALKVAPEADILEAYGISEEQYRVLSVNPAFVASLKSALELVAKDGMSFKLKARLQAEELLLRSWQMINDDETAASVRADLIKSTIKWAGLETSVNESKTSNIQPLQININLG